MSSSVIIGEGTSVKLVDGETGTGVVTDANGDRLFWKPRGKDRTFHFSTTGNTTVDVLVSNFNDPVNNTVWEKLATATGTGSVGFATTAPWKYISFDITANTGALTVTVAS